MSHNAVEAELLSFKSLFFFFLASEDCWAFHFLCEAHILSRTEDTCLLHFNPLTFSFSFNSNLNCNTE